jgi:hypothetical protein
VIPELLVSCCDERLEIEGHMNSHSDAKIIAFTSVNKDDLEIRFEKLQHASGEEKICLSCWKQGEIVPQPAILSEAELLKLFHQAIRAGVLSRNFMGRLREEIEI